MTTPKPSKTNSTEEDRLRRDEILMKKLRISHEPETTSDEWPVNLRNTFQSIVTLGSLKAQSYDDDVLPLHITPAWRQETKLRAKQLSDTARRLLKEKPSELTWRLEIEKLVDARFSLRTECKTCSGRGRSGRTWRSEIEVLTEANGPLVDDLKARRKTRVPCQCLDAVYSGLNPLFSNRADQVFRYDPHLMSDPENHGSGKGGKHNEKVFPERKPDRVYGLCQTSNFEERLCSPAKGILDDASEDAIAAIQRAVEANGEELLVQDFLQATPFHQRGEPLLFPFLILEAKSEEGRGHRNCGVQTSLPIWGLLKAQERLSELSCSLDELGGPFVWYISYLGDSWRVSGCHIAIEKAQKTYQIRDLWNGRISSIDGALQILLIIDYIFDWARDLYRPSILHCLGAMNDAIDDGMSFAADSDINSTRKTCRMDTPTEMESPSDFEALETSTGDESLLEPWRKHDMVESLGINEFSLRSFRSSYVFRSSFQCLYLTRDNMRSVLNCLGDSPSKYQKMARQALASLGKGPMVVTQRILSQIEHAWTGTIREAHRAVAGGKIFCSIVHTVSISLKTWELTRTLFCLALDEDTLHQIRQHADLKRPSFRLENMELTAPSIDEETVTAILEHLKSRSSQDTLSFALTNMSDVWKPASMLTRKEQKRIGHEIEQSVVLAPLINGDYPVWRLVQEIYRRHKPSGLLEPDAPCLRFSAQLERLGPRLSTSRVISLPIDPKQQLPQIPEDGAMLVAHKYRDQNHLCIYVTRDSGDLQDWTDLTSILATVISEQQFFMLARTSCNSIEDRVYRYHPKVQPGEVLFPLVKTAAQLWGTALYKRVMKEVTTDNIPEIFRYDEGRREELLELYYGSKRQPFSGISVTWPRPNKRPRFYQNHAAEEFEQSSSNSQGATRGSTTESDSAEIQALLEKWGTGRFSDALKMALTKR